MIAHRLFQESYFPSKEMHNMQVSFKDSFSSSDDFHSVFKNLNNIGKNKMA